MSSSIPTIEEVILEKGETGLGFNIRGGIDNIHIGNDPGIFVTTIKMNGAAAKDGRLKSGDKLLEINGNDLREVQHHKAVAYFHSAGNRVILLVERGAEQRITSQIRPDIVMDGNLMHNNMQRMQVVSQSTGWSRWRIAGTGLLLIGGSAAAVLLFWYLRKRRQ